MYIANKDLFKFMFLVPVLTKYLKEVLKIPPHTLSDVLKLNLQLSLSKNCIQFINIQN